MGGVVPEKHNKIFSDALRLFNIDHGFGGASTATPRLLLKRTDWATTLGLSTCQRRRLANDFLWAGVVPDYARALLPKASKPRDVTESAPSRREP